MAIVLKSKLDILRLYWAKKANESSSHLEEIATAMAIAFLLSFDKQTKLSTRHWTVKA